MKILTLMIIVMTASTTVTAAKIQYRLNDLIKTVEKHNLIIKMSALDNRIALMELKKSRRLPNPEFEYAFGEAQLPDRIAKPKVWQYSVKLTLPNPISRHFIIQSQKSTVGLSKIQTEIQKRQILNWLKVHFYKHQFYNKSLSLFKDKQRRLTTMVKIIEAKVKIGETKEIEGLRARVELQKNQAKLFALTRNRAYEKNKINEILNYKLAEKYTLVEDFSFTPLPNIEGKLFELLNTTPQIISKEYHLAIKNKMLKAKQNALIESIQIFTSKGKEIEGEVWRTGVGIQVPIFNSKSLEVKKARLEWQKAQIELEHAQKHLQAEIERIISEIRVQEKEIFTYNDTILSTGKENMLLSGKLYKNGEIPLIIFLDSQNSYFSMMDRYYQSISEWNILKANLESLIGGIN